MKLFLVWCLALCGTVLFVIAYTIHLPSKAEPTLGAALPSGTAVFETSLTSRISTSDTSMTLVSTSTRGGGSLNGYQCFTIDEGRTDAEYVCGTLTSAKTVTGLTRGLDPLTGTTTNATLQFAHRVGANVKITDFPLLAILRAQANGSDTYPNLLTYANTVWITAGSASTTIATKAYVDSVAVAGVSDANETTKGIGEFATQIEMASSTSAGGTSANLFLWAKYSTSSPGTAGLWTPVTMNNGKLSQSFLDLTVPFTWSGLNTFSGGVTSTGTTTISASNIFSNPLVLNGKSYAFPGTQGASGTVATLSGNGTIWWSTPTKVLYATTTNIAISSSVASTTIFTFNVPANSMGTSSIVSVKVGVGCAGGNSGQLQTGEIVTFGLYYGSNAIFSSYANGSGSTANWADGGTMEFVVMGSGATNTQEAQMIFNSGGVGINTAAVSYFRDNFHGTFATDSTADQTLKMEMRFTTSSVSDKVTFCNAYAVLYK